MHRSHHLLTMLALSACAGGGGDVSNDRTITISAGEKRASDTLHVPRAAKTRQRSPGSRASKRRQLRRRGWR